MFLTAPNPADVATAIAAAALTTRIGAPLLARPHTTTDAEPQTTVWLPVKIGGKVPTEGAVLMLTEPDHDVTIGGSLVYTLTDAATVVEGFPVRLSSDADRTVWSRHFKPKPPGKAERIPASENSGRLTCVATGDHVSQHDIVWLKLVVAGLVRTRLPIAGPPGTRTIAHGCRWTKITRSGDVVTAVLRAL